MVARVIYSVTLAMFFLRLLQYFLALKALGPKVIMIRGMVSQEDSREREDLIYPIAI